MIRVRWIIFASALPFLMAVGLAFLFSFRLNLLSVDAGAQTAGALQSSASVLFTDRCIAADQSESGWHRVGYCNHGVWLLLPDASESGVPPGLRPFAVIHGATADLLGLFAAYGLLMVVMPVGVLLLSVVAAFGMLGRGLAAQQDWIRRHLVPLGGMLLLLVFSAFSREMAPGDFKEHGLVAALVTVIGVGVLRYVVPKMPMQGLSVVGFLLFWVYALGLYVLSFLGVCWWSGVLLVSAGLLLLTLTGAALFAQLSRGAVCLLIFLVICLLRDFLSINIGLIDGHVRSSPWLLSFMAPGYFVVYGVVIAFWLRMVPVFSIYPRLFRIVLHQYKSLRESAKMHWATTNVSYLEKMHKKEREVILAERSAIYRELHDGVSSQLVALLFSVKGGSASLTALEAGLGRCLNQIKAILMGAAMDHGKSAQDVFFDYCFGLDDLFSDGHLVFEYSIEGGDYCFLDNSTHDLLKIFQEAVANALKHSGARKLHLSLRLGDADLRVVFTESEFSSGPALNQVASSGVGLLSQQQRAEQIGGEFSCRHTGEMRVTSVRVPLLMM